MGTEIFSQLAKTVNIITESALNWTKTVISVNYEVVSSIITVVSTIWNVIATIFITVHCLCTAVGAFAFELLAECFNVACMLLWIVQSVCKIIIQIFSLAEYLFYPFEVVVFYGSVGVRWVAVTVFQCMSSVFYGISASLVWTYAGLKLVAGQLFDKFDKLGSSFIWVVTNTLYMLRDGLYNCYEGTVEFLVLIASNLRHAILSAIDDTAQFFINTYNNINDSCTFEVYCGILILIVLYMATLWLRDFVSEHGLTFPAVFQFSDNMDNVPANDPADNSDTESLGSENSNFEEVGNDFGDSDEEGDIVLPVGEGLKKRPPTPAREQLGTSRSAKDLEDELEHERDKRLCVICQDQVKNVLLLPCKHLCACVDCANQLLTAVQLNRRVCPLCRCRIRQVIDVYT